MSRTDAIAFAGTHGIPVTHTLNKPYSIDANLWGRSIEAGALEDPWAAPPEDAYAWTAPPGTAEERELVVAFEAGVPVGVDDVRLDFAALIGEMNSLAGKCGVGRIDHVESRLVGFKSREVYEAPAAVVLIAAHRKLEALVLSRDELRFKAGVERRYAELIYDGLWRSPLRSHLDAFVDATQARVTGEVHLRLKRGVIEAAGVRSPFSLYDRGLATYADGDAFDHRAAEGFIHIWGLPLITTAKESNQTRPLPSQIEKVVGS
jgi:argininosuccinate synthase